MGSAKVQLKFPQVECGNIWCIFVQPLNTRGFPPYPTSLSLITNALYLRMSFGIKCAGNYGCECVWGKICERDLHHLLTCHRSLCIGGCSENQKHISPYLDELTIRIILVFRCEIIPVILTAGEFWRKILDKILRWKRGSNLVLGNPPTLNTFIFPALLIPSLAICL